MSKLKDVIISAIQDKKAKDIVALDLRNIDGTICDYFIVCNADSAPQLSAIVDEVEERAYVELQEKVIRIQGKENGIWIAMDFGDIIVHVFETEAREFYNLEDMWGDADLEEFESFE
ncbi:MAG: ribosome silencing factor [Rikenellaceae bacterium]